MPGYTSSGAPILSVVDQVEGTAVLLAADALIVINMFGKPKWGIFQNGVAAMVPDSIVAVEFASEWQIATYSQELGGFQSYNKVAQPYKIKVTMTKGGAGILSAIGIGSAANVKSFLTAVETAAASLNLYDVRTPDRTYYNANIEHYDYRRSSANGVSLLTVDLWLQEVRANTSTTYTQTQQLSNTQSAAAAQASSTGTVQATTPSPAQGAAAASGLQSYTPASAATASPSGLAEVLAT